LQWPSLIVHSFPTHAHILLHHYQYRQVLDFVDLFHWQLIDRCLKFPQHLCEDCLLGLDDREPFWNHLLQLCLKIYFSLSLIFVHQQSCPLFFDIFISFYPYFIHASSVCSLNRIHCNFYSSCWLSLSLTFCHILSSSF